MTGGMTDKRVLLEAQSLHIAWSMLAAKSNRSRAGHVRVLRPFAFSSGQVRDASCGRTVSSGQ